jgi:uncharacterized protein
VIRHLLLTILLTSLLYVPPAIGSEVPYLSGRVNDIAGILSHDTHNEIEALLKAHEDSTSNQVVVLTLQSLEGESIEEYANRVANAWKLGQKGKDNGVLLVIAKDDRKLRIEVGRGLEGDLTDLICSSIIRHVITPRFRDGDYDAGVRDGVLAILSAIRGSYSAEEAEEGSDFADIGTRIFVGVMFFVIVGLFTSIALFSSGGRSWFLYVFLFPFWGLFPQAIFGSTGGLIAFGTYAIGFLLFKLWYRKSDTGRAWSKKLQASSFFGSALASGSHSSGSSWSSSGSSFSGGGGSFGGGGSSGSW